MRDLTLCLLLAGAGAAAAPQRAPFAPPFPTEATLDANGIDAEYRRPISAKGVAPDWTARVEVGEVRLRIAGLPERRIPLLTPYRCFVVGCDGVMIEQAVAHRHHGVSILKTPCRLPGSDRSYPYQVNVSVLRSPEDTQGVRYRGCGWPATY